jgi:hypothetical protein
MPRDWLLPIPGIAAPARRLQIRIPAKVNAHSGMVNPDFRQRERCGGSRAMLRTSMIFEAGICASQILRGLFGLVRGLPFKRRFTRDREPASALHPLAQRHAHHLTTLNAAPGAAVNVLYGRLQIFKARLLEQAGLPFVIARVHHPVHQQPMLVTRTRRFTLQMKLLIFSVSS